MFGGVLMMFSGVLTMLFHVIIIVALIGILLVAKSIKEEEENEN